MTTPVAPPAPKPAPIVSPWVARALEQRGTLRGGLPAPTLAPVRRAK